MPWLGRSELDQRPCRRCFGWGRDNYVRHAPQPLVVAITGAGLLLTWPTLGAAHGAQTSLAVDDDQTGSMAPLAFDALDRRRDAPVNEEPYYRSDGVYGRFDGELMVMPSVGLQWAHAGWFTQLGLSAYYLNTVGVQFHLADGRWSPLTKRADFNVATLSVAVRPLFLWRWSKDLEQGPSFLDLTIDSLTLAVGAYYSQQRSLDVQRQGLETELSFGFPLLGVAHGPWLTASAVNRLPKVTHATSRIDMTYGLRFEWSFSLGN